MTEAEKEKLVAEWIEFQSIPLEEQSRDFRKKYAQSELFGSVEKLNEVCRTNPELAWEMILRIHRAEHNEYVTANLAAGLLEDLLADYGEQFIERVEIEARRDPKFNFLLGGVWQNSMTEDIWRRVQKARHEVW